MNKCRHSLYHVVMIVIASAAMALTPHATISEHHSAPAPARVSAPASASLRATINPETGKPEISGRGTALVLDPDTREALRRDNEGLVEIHHPNGAVSVRLEGRFRHASVARIGENGKAFVCVGDTSLVREFEDAPVRSAEVK